MKLENTLLIAVISVGLVATAAAQSPFGDALKGVERAAGMADSAAKAGEAAAGAVTGNMAGGAAAAQGAAKAAPAAATDLATHALVSSLTGQLGVSNQQAIGGVGSIFSVAKGNMNAADFGQVSSAVPGLDQFIGAAPKQQGVAGGLAAAAGALGGSKVGSMAQLAGMFSQLDMNQSMMSQFVPIVLGYLQTQGGDSLSTLVQTALAFQAPAAP